MRWMNRVGWVLVLCLGAPIGLAPAFAAPTEQAPDGHVEIVFSGSRGAALDAQALPTLLPAVRAAGFLESPGVASADPLAPCALLAALLSADQLNRMFFGLAVPGGFDFRAPRGTFILGRYDDDLARGKGSIPRDDPAKAADMLARSVVLNSWMLSTKLNTLVAKLSQGDCLRLLVEPEQLGRAARQLDPAKAVMTHAAPVAAWITTVEGDQGRAWFAALLEPGFLDRPSAAGGNLLEPCMLVPAFRLAARLNDAWTLTLPAGRLDSAGRSELEPYADALRKPLGAQGADARTAELLAAAVAAETRRANELSARLVAQATQGECLAELFQPGGLRRKLERGGETLPLK